MEIHLYHDRKKNGFDRISDCYFGRRGRTAKHSVIHVGASLPEGMMMERSASGDLRNGKVVSSFRDAYNLQYIIMERETQRQEHDAIFSVNHQVRPQMLPPTWRIPACAQS